MSNGSVNNTAGFDISSTEKGHDSGYQVKLFSMTVTPTINATNVIGNVQEAELTGIASVDIIYL